MKIQKKIGGRVGWGSGWMCRVGGGGGGVSVDATEK